MVLIHDRDRSQAGRDIRAGVPLQWYGTPEIGWFRAIILLLGDGIALAIAWHHALRVNGEFSPLPPRLNWGEWLGMPGLFWVFAGAIVTFFVAHNFYASTSQWRNYVKQAQTISALYLCSLVVSYFFDPSLDAPRSLFLTAWLGSVACVVGGRLVMTLLLEQFYRARTGMPVFLIAPADRLATLSELIERRTDYRIVGVLVSSLALTPSAIRAIQASGAREAIVESLPETPLASSLYWQLRNAQIGLRLIPSSVAMLHRRGTPEIFAGMPTIRIEPRVWDAWDYRFKRLMDLVGAALGLVLLLPLFAATAIAIAIVSPGNVFYTQERVGLRGQVFRMWKFRSMFPHADRLQAELEHLNESKDGVLFKLKHDPRLIPIGRFLRRTSLDELPQLINILLGKMSFVGPRPLPLRDVSRFGSWHHARHLVVPGITGVWQISGRSHLNSIDDMARLDLFYIDHWSLNFDLEILVETLRIILFGQGAY